MIDVVNSLGNNTKYTAYRSLTSDHKYYMPIFNYDSFDQWKWSIMKLVYKWNVILGNEKVNKL